MQIKLYSFQKRNNSTKSPVVSGSGATPALTLTGYLRQPSSVINPVFQIKRIENDASPDLYNYAYIPAFRRFYFITDWIWVDGLWECHCNDDVLASWKSQIANIDAYIERCAGNADPQDITRDWDGAIIDRMYPAKTDFDCEETYINVEWNYSNINDGCYVLGVFGGQANSIGSAVNYWALTSTQMGNFMSYLLGDSFFDNAGFGLGTTEVLTRNMAKALMNPLQYIASCMWFPFPSSYISGGTSRNIQIGPYQLASGTGPQGVYLGATGTHIYDFDVDVPIHPQATTRGKYLMYPPFSKYSLILPPFGTMPIDYSFFEVGDKLNVNVMVDCVTGKARLYLGAKDYYDQSLLKKRFYETSTQFGVPIQIAQVANDFISATTSFINANTSAHAGAMQVMGATQGGIAGLTGAVHETGMMLNSIANAVESTFPQLVSHGINGSFSSFRGTPVLLGRFAVVVDENRAEIGRPLCAIRRISSLSGYIKCADVHVEFYCLADEERKIKEFMTSGFFFE